MNWTQNTTQGSTQTLNDITHVMDDSDMEGELSDVEIERQQEELYCQEQAQILQAERFSDPDWVPHISWKKWKVANYGEEGNTGA